MDETKTAEMLAPAYAWAIRKALTYGLTTLAAALGIQQGLGLEWVLPASVALGTILSVLTGKILKRLYAAK